jgi:hypothetical protein
MPIMSELGMRKVKKALSIHALACATNTRQAAKRCRMP